MANPNVGQVVATTWERLVTESPEDQIFKDRWLFNQLTKENGGLIKKDGGSPIVVPLVYAKNTTFRSYSDSEVLDVQRMEIIDQAEYEWREHSGTVSYSVIQEFKNSGDGQKVDLIAALVENAMNSHKDDISDALFGDGTGNGGKNVLGLKALIPASPGASVARGGINYGTFTFWRSNQASGAKTSTAFDNLRAKMRTMYNTCSNGQSADHPSSIATDQTTFEGYESLLTANERYDMSDKKKGADAGYSNDVLKFKGAQISYDPGMTAGYMYFWNPKAIQLVVAKGIFLKLGKELEPVNQHLRVRKIHSILQFISRQPRRTGVLTACD